VHHRSIFLSPNISARETDSVNKTVKETPHLPASHTNKSFLSANSLIIPLRFIHYGFFTLKAEELQELNQKIAEEIKEDAPEFKTRVDDIYNMHLRPACIY